MRPALNRTFEFVVEEKRTYTVQGDGYSAMEAEQDAIDRFHRLRKSNDLPCDEVGKPKVIKVTAHGLTGIVKYSK